MLNPCDGVRAALPKRNGVEKHHESIPYPELPGFIQKLRTSPSALCVKLAFEFLILTSARTGEVLDARWDEFDIENAVWVVPAARMKMKVEHKVPLAVRCIEILDLAKQFNDGAIVFPGRKAGEPLSNAAFLMALRRMGYEEATAHGFRATFKTWAEEKTKFDSLVIEAALAHRVQGIERHYLRTTFFDQRCKLMAAWAAFAIATPMVVKVVAMRSRGNDAKK
jgi:integrase